MKILFAVMLVSAAILAGPVAAATTVFSGNTTGGQTYNRPLSGRPPSSLSAVGTAVRFVVTPFNVTVSGNYNFNNTSTYDNFLGVYVGSFNPATPLINALAYDDDAGPGSNAFISALGLTSGLNYFGVSSGFANTDFGAFTLTVDGPGNIIGGTAGGVPEPASWAMLIAGFGLVGATMRRRRMANLPA